MFAMFFNVVFAVFVCYPAAFCQLCFYNKDWIGLDVTILIDIDPMTKSLSDTEHRNSKQNKILVCV